MVWHTREGNRIETLFKHVIARALDDAFFLKKKVKVKRLGGLVRHSYGIAKKADAVTWLRGENDLEGLDIVCTIAGLPTNAVIKRCREWFSGEHIDGYEFKNKEEFRNVMGFDIRCIERDLRRENSDSNGRRKNARGVRKKTSTTTNSGMEK